MDQRLQESSKELKQILMDQHFQTVRFIKSSFLLIITFTWDFIGLQHIELPTFALYRHVTTFISNPTKISEAELIEACSRRHSPSDILSV